MSKNVTLIKSGITISVSVSVKTQKNILRVKKVIFGIIQQVAALVILQVIQHLYVMKL